MFGIEWYECVLVLKQIGLAVGGAAALWGFVFSRKDYACGKKECVIWDFIASKLSLLVFGGIALSFASFLFLHSKIVAAHEGIVIFPSVSEISSALSLTFPLWILLIALSLVALLFERKNKPLFDKLMSPYYLTVFILTFILASLPAWTGELSLKQLFFAGHGFHSIFTVGTVLVLDFLFLLSKKSEILKQHVFAEFPLISKVIWVGLAFDFASSILILDSFVMSTKFLFMQTVIGVLIINGTLLSGPLTRRMINTVTEGGDSSSRKFNTFANLAGTISVTSWLTITVVDAFEHLTLSYAELLLGYLSLILFIFLLHEAYEAYERKREAPLFIH